MTNKGYTFIQYNIHIIMHRLCFLSVFNHRVHKETGWAISTNLVKHGADGAQVN